MFSFIDINNEIRNFLEKTYRKFYNENETDEACVKYFEFIEQLKSNNFKLYKLVVGLAFSDSYRLLMAKKKFGNLKEIELNNLEVYEQIIDIDELLHQIDEKPLILSSIIYSPIKFNHFNLLDKANILMQLNDDYINSFNPFNFFEKYNMFKERTVEEFIFIYLNDSKNGKEKNETVFTIVNTLDLLFKYKYNNYSKLLLDMVRTYYRFKKVIQYINPELTFGVDDMIITAIENNSLDEIIYILSCDNDMITALVEDFLEYKTNQEIKKEYFDKVYNRLVSKEVKIKLKET